jgi:hypothetical protein
MLGLELSKRQLVGSAKMETVELGICRKNLIIQPKDEETNRMAIRKDTQVDGYDAHVFIDG